MYSLLDGRAKLVFYFVLSYFILYSLGKFAFNSLFGTAAQMFPSSVRLCVWPPLSRHFQHFPLSVTFPSLLSSPFNSGYLLLMSPKLLILLTWTEEDKLKLGRETERTNVNGESCKCERDRARECASGTFPRAKRKLCGWIPHVSLSSLSTVENNREVTAHILNTYTDTHTNIYVYNLIFGNPLGHIECIL